LLYAPDYGNARACPATAGKSAFSRQFISEQASAIERRIGVSLKERQALLLDRESGKPHVPRLDAVVMIHSILRAFKRSGSVYARDELLDVMGCADPVVFVTLWKPAPALARGYEK
jgi:hypothetical protein